MPIQRPGADPDVVIVGLGPGGRALAHRCVVAGLSVVAVDPHPERQWQATYGAWADELPGWLDPASIAMAVDAPAVHTGIARVVRRRYVVFDSAKLQRSLSLPGVRIIALRATQVLASSVGLRDGTVITARVVVDARGLTGQVGLPEQTAYGLIVSAAAAAPALQGQQAWFMDWRQDHDGEPQRERSVGEGAVGADPGSAETDTLAAPSFLYAVPLCADYVLLEETCLAGTPALKLGELKGRLLRRLEGRGVRLTGDEEVELVRFPLHPHERPSPDAYGARSGMAHPATGYSVASSLAWADSAAQAIGRRQRVGSAIWPRGSGAVRELRFRGLTALLALPPRELPQFFAAFFSLPERRQRDFLSNRTSVAAVGLAMAGTFAKLPMGMRIRVARATFRPSR